MSFLLAIKRVNSALEDGILVSQPSPLGEGAPQGRIGQTWYERQKVV